MQEAYVHGYWEEMAVFIRSLFNSTFKTNPYMERAIMTGITRVSKASIFSDLNHLAEFHLTEQMPAVKHWYDGFIFGTQRDIYNPWSIINYLKTKKFTAYWANTSSNSLVSKLIREAVPEVKIVMENLLKGGTLRTQIDEQIVFSQLYGDETAIWSLLLTSGYLKVESYTMDGDYSDYEYELSLTNNEVKLMFERLVRGWFGKCAGIYNRFIRALLSGNLEDMNGYMGHAGYSTKENVNNIKIVHLHWGLQLIFDESQKEGNNEIWIDVYPLTRFLAKHTQAAVKVEGTKEWRRTNGIVDPKVEEYEARLRKK